MILHLLLVGTFDMSWYFIVPENWASRQCPGRDLRTCYKMLRDVSIRICLALGSFHILPPPRYHNMPQKSLFETRTSRIISHISPSSPTTRSTVRWAPWTYASMPQFTKWLTPQETTGDHRRPTRPRKSTSGYRRHCPTSTWSECTGCVLCIAEPWGVPIHTGKRRGPTGSQSIQPTNMDSMQGAQLQLVAGLWCFLSRAVGHRASLWLLHWATTSHSLACNAVDRTCTAPRPGFHVEHWHHIMTSLTFFSLNCSTLLTRLSQAVVF